MSVALPTESEKRASDALIEELRRQKTFEKPSDTEKRYTPKGLDLLTIVANASLCSNEFSPSFGLVLLTRLSICQI